jgi:hypothetical protein
MKTRVRDPGNITEQLQAGTDAIQTHSHFKIHQGRQSLIALLLHDRHIRTSDFTRRRITFQGKPVIIIHKHCRIALEDLLE